MSGLFSGYLVTASAPQLSLLVPYARGRGYGLEIKDFVWAETLTDRRRRSQTLGAYRRVLPLLSVPAALHGPFDDLSFGSQDPDIARISRQRVTACLDVAEELRVPRVVFHTCWHHADPQPWYKQEWVRRQAEFWQTVLRRRSVEVLLENLWDPEPELFASAIAAVGMATVGACLDVGHAHVHTRYSPDQWVAALGAQLRHLHLHDNRQEYDQHLTPGDGTLDWAALAAALRELGQTPAATLEVGLDQVEEAVRLLEGL